MNRDETKEAIEVMQAWVDGADIEHRVVYRSDLTEWTPGRDVWTPVDDPAWAWHHCDYRIKPTPREWYISENGCVAIPAELYDPQQIPGGAIHVREVIE